MIGRQEAMTRPLIEGWSYTDDEERGFLYDLAASAPDGKALEVGVLFGASFVSWAPAREGRGEVIVVDNWSNHPNGYQDIEGGFRKNIAHYGLKPTILTGLSWEVASLVGESLAFVYIDGDHLAGVAKDIAAYCPLLMSGGIVAFHDYTVSKKTRVIEAVDAWVQAEQWPEIGRLHRMIAFRKP